MQLDEIVLELTPRIAAAAVHLADDHAIRDAGERGGRERDVRKKGSERKDAAQTGHRGDLRYGVVKGTCAPVYDGRRDLARIRNKNDFRVGREQRCQRSVSSLS